LEISSLPPVSSIATRSYPGRYENLARIGAFVREMAQQAGLTGFAVYSVEMAVDEACSNIIEHSYGGENRGEIVCTCTVDQEGLTVVLQDEGKPFDPSKVKAPNLKAGLKERDSHGLGLHFIYEWMDKVVFEAGPKLGNRLTMVKLRSAAEAPPAR